MEGKASFVLSNCGRGRAALKTEVRAIWLLVLRQRKRGAKILAGVIRLLALLTRLKVTLFDFRMFQSSGAEKSTVQMVLKF